MPDARWIDLDGASNVRDLAGLPTSDGRSIAEHRLVRADNLQTLSEADVRHLVDEVGVRTVVDLRARAEVLSEGPGPITHAAQVAICRLPLFPEAPDATDEQSAAAGAVVLPRQGRGRTRDRDGRSAASAYLRYLDDRPDSILAALRTIANSPGATVVHCAAGKDRTGVVIAFTLAEVGVEPSAIVEDYAHTADRIGAIVERLRASVTYAHELTDDVDNHRPRAETMETFLHDLDARGGIPAWLREHGWTDSDAVALREQLLG